MPCPYDSNCRGKKLPAKKQAAPTLRWRTAGFQEESSSPAIHDGNVKVETVAISGNAAAASAAFSAQARLRVPLKPG
jgi:hypothetical protein